MTDEDMAWKYPNGIRHYSDIFQDRHRKRWKIGDWTDDTDMMLCIANAVIKDKGVNLTSIARNFKDWADGEPMGYTLKSLAAGLWAYWNAKSFEDGLLSVVRAGGDADTNAAVACAILGAKYGFSSIPDEYVNGLIYKEQLEEVVNGMIGLAK